MEVVAGVRCRQPAPTAWSDRGSAMGASPTTGFLPIKLQAAKQRPRDPGRRLTYARGGRLLASAVVVVAMVGVGLAVSTPASGHRANLSGATLVVCTPPLPPPFPPGGCQADDFTGANLFHANLAGAITAACATAHIFVLPLSGWPGVVMS